MTKPMETWRFPNGEVVNVDPDFYPASCDHCGWQGSSEDAINSPTGGDDYEVLCPKCYRSGACGGKAGEGAARIDQPDN